MRTIFLILISLSMRSQTILGYAITDKDLHDQAGMVISGLAGSSAYFFGLTPFRSCAIGVGAACLVGVGKELYDKYSGKGVPDFWDGFTTGFGGVRMAICLRIGIDRNERRNEKKLLYLQKQNL